MAALDLDIEVVEEVKSKTGTTLSWPGLAAGVPLGNMGGPHVAQVPERQ
jgi:hypothetical protein